MSLSRFPRKLLLLVVGLAVLAGLNQLIEMYINGEVAIGDFLEEAFGEP